MDVFKFKVDQDEPILRALGLVPIPKDFKTERESHCAALHRLQLTTFLWCEVWAHIFDYYVQLDCGINLNVGGTVWFGNSPDAGMSECICSACGKQITEDDVPAVRCWKGKDKQTLEARFHEQCFKQRVRQI